MALFPVPLYWEHLNFCLSQLSCPKVKIIKIETPKIFSIIALQMEQFSFTVIKEKSRSRLLLEQSDLGLHFLRQSVPILGIFTMYETFL